MKSFAFHFLIVVALLSLSMATWADQYKPRNVDFGESPSPTQYDWKEVAERITDDCATDYERLKVIYEWECKYIDFDTSYTIHTADSCYNNMRGVCQGYCELFYYIAAALGIKVEIVSGKSKNYLGQVSDDGHTWLFAYISEDSGILIDPTWGAGQLNNGVFERNKDHSLWFDVDPEWLILSHYPTHEVYQFLSEPLSEQEFRNLPVANTLWKTYGIPVHYIYEHLKAGDITLPKFYNRGEGEFEIIEIPMQDTLRIGSVYTFRIRMKTPLEFVVINRPIYCKRPEWKDEGDGVYSFQFMPRDTTRVTFALADKTRANFWNNVLEYAIAPPTQGDWARVEKKYPLSMPEVKNVGHLYAEEWEKAGYDGQRLLKVIREQHITDLPSLHSDKGQKLQIATVPMMRRLKNGQTYTFTFFPQSGVKWALVLNDTQWFDEWKQENNGAITMDVTLKSSGFLRLYVQMKEGENFWSCLDYDVE